MNGLDKCYGLRFEPEFSSKNRLHFSVEWNERSAINEVYLTLPQSRYLLSATELSIKSFGVGVGISHALTSGTVWNARLYFVGVFSGPRRVSLLVTSPSGLGAFYEDSDAKQLGFALRTGCRVSRSLYQGVNLYAEVLGALVIRDDYEWGHQGGLVIQPISPQQTSSFAVALGLEFGFR